MSVQAVSEVTPNGIINRHTIVIQWGGSTKILQGDTCAADQSIGGAGLKSVQIEGTFGGATVAIQGSNDGVTFETLFDASNSAISKTSAALVQILTPSLWIQPLITGGNGTTSLMITIIALRQF